MKTKPLTEMERLLELKFRKKQSSYARVLEQEARIRGQLNKLDRQVRDADLTNSYDIKAIGADVIWKSWVERSKRKLNLELAQILAHKESLKGAVQKEYGKLLVSRELLDVQKSETATTRKKDMLARAVDGHIQRSIRHPLK